MKSPTFLLVLILVSGCACAADSNPLGVYVGGSIGRWDVHLSQLWTVTPSGEPEIVRHPSGWTVSLGIRPVRLVGAELEYLDFGTIYYQPSTVRTNAEALAAVLYAPIPVSFLDVYAKVGPAHWHTIANGHIVVFCPALDTTCGDIGSNLGRTDLFYGAGVQFNLGPVALRTEYERLNAAPEHPYMYSLGLTWTFAPLPASSEPSPHLLGLYIGGSLAQARMETAETVTFPPITLPGMVVPTTTVPVTPAFTAHATGFKVTAGVRPLPWLGAELDYDDFGDVPEHYPGQLFGSGTRLEQSVTMRGGSAFGVLYLPLPHFDLFAKAGAAVIKSSLTTVGIFNPSGSLAIVIPIGPGTVDRMNSGFAAGAGAQWRLGHLALRGEYERFSAAGAHPELLSLGAIWTL